MMTIAHIVAAGQAPVTMTSLELVDFINEQRAPGEPELTHANFLAKVPKVLGETSHLFECDLPDSYGRSRRGYRFPKREDCLMAMSRNTSRVVGLQVNLVRPSGQAHKAAQQRQHYLHMNVNKLLNKVAGIDAGKRGTAQQGSLALLTVGQMLTVQAVAGAGDHKTAYERIKNALQPLQTLLPAGGTATC